MPKILIKILNLKKIFIKIKRILENMWKLNLSLLFLFEAFYYKLGLIFEVVLTFKVGLILKNRKNGVGLIFGVGLISGEIW